MANNNKTVFQRLSHVIMGVSNGQMNDMPKKTVSYNLAPSNSNDVLYTFDNKEERDAKLLQLRQEKFLQNQWYKVNYDTTNNRIASLSQAKIMYRDADLMDLFPEIGRGLTIVSEESTTINEKGEMLNIYSQSPRIKAVLNDLFCNRLDIKVILPMIARSTAKYGNEYMLLNIDSDNGIVGWKELPIHEITRVEGGLQNYVGVPSLQMNPNDVKFIWEGHNEAQPFQNWQVAHFRLINNSIHLPLGTSWLNPARRHWRMLSMMEDAMLVYRLERSVERRMFKVNVGLIDDADVPAYMQDFATSIKRAPIIDPETGQVDLRKNFLDVSADYFIPVRNGQDPSTIETLGAANNPTSMDDIKYIQNKILCALGIPKEFLNFEQQAKQGGNLSLMDIRFARTINTIQQALLLELNKIAIIHLYLLGFTDDLTNFSLTLNNPSSQIELAALDLLSKRLTAASTAMATQDGGLPLMSWHMVQKTIMGKTDAEIADMLNEIRIESALVNELQLTNQIITKTGLFNKADRIYGNPGATYQQQQQDDNGGLGGGPGGPGGPPLGGGFGDGLGGFDEPGGDMSDFGGEEEGTDLGGSAPDSEGEAPQLQETIHNLIDDFNKQSFFTLYNSKVLNSGNNRNQNNSIVDKTVILTENINKKIENIEKKFYM